MGILDDIKNMQPLPEHKWTLKKLLKVEKKLLKKNEKSLLKELMKKDNNSIKCDVSIKDDYNSVIITAPNGCIITINKDNINDFIMTDEDVSKVVEILKKEIIVKKDNKESSEITYIRNNFKKLSIEGLNYNRSRNEVNEK